jgi:hypothetical protein
VSEEHSDSNAEWPLLEVRAAFAFLERENGFRVLDEAYFPKEFGNLYVEYGLDDLRILVLTDRGEFWFYAGSSRSGGKLKFDAQVILKFLGADKEARALIAQQWHDLPLLRDSLHRHLSEICQMFGPDRYKETGRRLSELQERRSFQLSGPAEEERPWWKFW